MKNVIGVNMSFLSETKNLRHWPSPSLNSRLTGHAIFFIIQGAGVIDMDDFERNRKILGIR